MRKGNAAFHWGYATALSNGTCTGANNADYMAGWNLGVIHRQNGKRLIGYRQQDQPRIKFEN